jgi:serine/threonine-protein kinase RsbW
VKPRTLTLASDINELSRVIAMVDAFCMEVAASPMDTSTLHLALEEVVTNVITHGYPEDGGHTFTVTLEAIASDRIRAVVVDDAFAYNPLARPVVDTGLPLEDRPIGGLGVHLVRRLMDVCLYERNDGRNVFTIEHKLNRATAASAHIAATKQEASAVLALTGRLDGLSSPELERQVKALVATGARTLVFDLSALDYVSSAGLRVFILAAKTLNAAQGLTKFASLTPCVREVFHVGGLLNVLDVEPPS